MFDKVKAIFVGLGFTVLFAGMSASLTYSETINWSGLGAYGPPIGLVVGTSLAAGIAFLKKENTGYGQGQLTQEKELS